MIRATQIKGAPRWGLLGCTLLLLLLLAAVGCTREKSVMPTVSGVPATVTLADHGVGLLTGSDNGQPCYELRVAAGAPGDASVMTGYSCIQPRDQLSTSFLIADGRQLAGGGAVAPSVATVTVNGQPTYRDGPFFLAVLPTIPADNVSVVAADKDGRVVVSQTQPMTLITSQQMSPPPRP